MITTTPTGPAISPLENGDRLSRAEFERRYDAMPQVKKAELIEGEVYMSSPVRIHQHSEPQLDLLTLLGIYRAFTPGVRGSDTGTTKLDVDNEHQPDAALFIDPELGGQAQIDQDDYLVGAPELAVEIASSSASIDLGKKLNVYRRTGVREYIVWRVRERALDWFILQDGQYLRQTPADGVIKSTVFPGLWIHTTALLRKDLPAAHATVQQGLASAEHQAFVLEIASKRTPT